MRIAISPGFHLTDLGPGGGNQIIPAMSNGDQSWTVSVIFNPTEFDGAHHIMNVGDVANNFYLDIDPFHNTGVAGYLYFRWFMGNQSTFWGWLSSNTLVINQGSLVPPDGD